MISSKYIKEFETNGFLKVPEAFFTSDEFAKLSQCVFRFSEKHFQKKSGFRRYAWVSEPDLMDFACHRKVLDFLQNFLGPNIALHAGSIYKKEAHSDVVAPWHSDVSNFYRESENMRSLSLTIAITDCTKTSGCLEYAPGSHKKWARTHLLEPNPPATSLFGKGEHFELTEDEIKSLSPPVLMELKASEASITDLACVHRSGPNHSDKDRIILVFRYFSTSYDSGISDYVKNFWKGVKYTILVSGEDQLGICNYNLVPAAKK